MSKGHCTGALYSALAGAGFFPEAELDTYLKPESRLNGHPNRTYLPGVETNTGPLGHGLPVAVGIAVAAQLDGADHHVFAPTGVRALPEGRMWEVSEGRRVGGEWVSMVSKQGWQEIKKKQQTN